MFHLLGNFGQLLEVRNQLRSIPSALVDQGKSPLRAERDLCPAPRHPILLPSKDQSLRLAVLVDGDGVLAEEEVDGVLAEEEVDGEDEAEAEDGEEADELLGAEGEAGRGVLLAGRREGAPAVTDHAGVNKVQIFS